VTKGDDLLITRLVQIEHLLALGVPGMETAAAEATLRDASAPPGIVQKVTGELRASGPVSRTEESCRDAFTDKTTAQLVTEPTKT
jgi:hypothetical protein